MEHPLPVYQATRYHTEIGTTLARGLRQAISAFSHPNFLAEARLMNILITMMGGLQFLLQPNVKVPMNANFRHYLFQVELNTLVSGQSL